MEEVKINGWNMLDSYKEGQAIYGRDEEIESISESILYNVQTFVYGKSGIGKTSLLQAGVFPVLRRNHYFPVIIRLAFYEKESLESVVKRLVLEEAKTENLQIGKPPLKFHTIDDIDISGCSLQTFFSKVKFEDEKGEPYIPVLIFDQFEETINNEDNWQRTVDFLKNDLYDLLDNSSVISGETLSYTNYRIVISMREDYLYCLEDIVDQFSLWELRYNRFRIKALNDKKAAEVIQKTSGVNGLEEGKEDLIVNTIIRIVKLNSGTRFTEINTALLSLVCSLLYENSENACIRYNDLRSINSYLRSYYDEICDKIGSTATHYLENHLLTKDGRRSSMDESEAIKSGEISQETLDYLVEKKLLRLIKTDINSNRYEYIHDLFAKMVFKRLQEDKSKWFYPALRTLSRKEDRPSFLRKMVLTFICISVVFTCVLLYHSLSKHDTWNFLVCYNVKGICQNSTSPYWITLIGSTYLLSLVCKRLHDVGKSGWLCFILPFSTFLIYCEHYKHYFIFFPFEESNFLFQFVRIIGISLLVYFLYICLKPSVKDIKRTGYSKEYEAIFNLSPVSNIEFVKALAIELIWWVMCCCLTEMLLYYMLYDINWYLFDLKTVVPPLDIFGIKETCPAVLSLLYVVILLSPALKARVNTLGYSIWISYIPFLNYLLVLEGLFPDKFLKKCKLIELNKSEVKVESDNIFDEICDDFTIDQNENPLDQFGWKTILLLVFVPFYGISKGFDKNLSIKNRRLSLVSGIINIFFSFYYLYILYLLNFRK